MQDNRIPLMCEHRCLELAGPARVDQLLKAPNVKAIRRRKDRRIVELQVRPFGDDSIRPERRGNPLKYSSKGETERNPPNCWTLKHLPKDTRSVFRAVTEGCLALR